MVPFVGVPETIASGMSAYRGVFFREAGFDHISRYVSGLLLSENKTLQGIQGLRLCQPLHELLPNGSDCRNCQSSTNGWHCCRSPITSFSEAERRYLQMTAQPSCEQMEAVIQRLIELLHHQKNRLGYRKRTEIAVELVQQIEAEGRFPKADYAFDNGALSVGAHFGMSLRGMT